MKTTKGQLEEAFEAIRLLGLTVNDLATAAALHEERIAKLEKFEALHLVDDMKKIVKG